jgi:hypothetical protein
MPNVVLVSAFMTNVIATTDKFKSFFSFSIVRPLSSTESTLELPAFTICVDPFINITSVEELRLDPTLWSMFKYTNEGSNFSAWPIKDPVKDSNLYEKTVFHLNELVKDVYIVVNGENKSYKNLTDNLSDELLTIKVTNARQ